MEKKYAIITGAAKGMGKDIAFKFAIEGYHVFLITRKSINELHSFSEDLEKFGASYTEIIGDVGNPQDIEKIKNTIFSITDYVDVLVNNAGIAHIGLLQNMSNEDWDEIIKTNLNSVFYMSKMVIPSMIHKKAGSIINISSMWGSVGASMEVAYSASKGGVESFTKALSKELAPSGIAVNAISPGVVNTSMNSHLSKKELENLALEIPAGRFATTSEIADLVWNVANSPSYMTGQVIGINGGYI
ncbi:MAG: SDR family NAD(P)-dependent oxidoreductase [Lachnospiraceae bacterium]|nr:SDR family NAD(P)-dependent oxidoreductase [Lachnospiraceae bacterium]